MKHSQLLGLLLHFNSDQIQDMDEKPGTLYTTFCTKELFYNNEEAELEQIAAFINVAANLYCFINNYYYVGQYFSKAMQNPSLISKCFSKVISISFCDY